MKKGIGIKEREGVTELVLRTTEQLLEALRPHERGDRCPSEQEMARRCGVSRTTVRQGYAHLEGKGLVARRAGGRYLLRKPQARDHEKQRSVAVTKEEAVVRALLSRVGSGRIVPGQRVSERTLALELGCSVAPVREALLSLVPLGIFRKEKRRQWEAVRLTPTQCVELIEFRKVVEGYCLRKLFMEGGHRRHRPAMEELLKESRHLLKMEAIDREIFLRVDVAFHTFLLESSGNGLLAERSRFIYGLIDFQFGKQHFSGERARAGIEQHAGMLEAMLSGESQEAERILMEHLDAACGNLLRLAESPETH